MVSSRACCALMVLAKSPRSLNVLAKQRFQACLDRSAEHLYQVFREDDW